MKHLVAVGTLLLASSLLPSVALANPHVDAAGRLIRGDHSCGTRPVDREILSPYAALPAPGRRIVYMNKNGGTYTVGNGATNAATNAVNNIVTPGGETGTATIAPLESSYNWSYIVSCVKEAYQPYNVTFVETEPTSGTYIEAVVGGNGEELGFGPEYGILGVAAADNFCDVTERGVAFNFSANHVGIQNANDELCGTIAHEIGHLLSLEHEVAPRDIMSYVPFAVAGEKSFLDQHARCGTSQDSTNNCSCPTTSSGETTNSAQRLRQHVGARPTESVPPSLTVTSPGDNAKLRPSFDVVATASDDTAMDGVEVYVDGVERGHDADPEGTTYTVSLADIALGAHTLEVRAVDLSGNETAKMISIEVALNATGEACVSSSDCTGGLCATLDDAKYCTQACSDTNVCPSGFTCNADPAVCVPASDDGGGCGVAGSSPGLLVLSLGAMVVVLRRRRS